MRTIYDDVAHTLQTNLDEALRVWRDEPEPERKNDTDELDEMIRNVEAQMEVAS